jgi:serpin B
MARVLHLPADREAVRSGFRELIARLNGDGGERPYRLASANSLWGQKGDHFLPDFVRTLADVYGAEFHPVDFRHAAEAARRAINAWVDGKTNHLIPELLAPHDVRSDTSLVLVNTVYFKGSWLYPFAKTATAPADFHRGDGSVVSVPMMRQTHRLSHAQGDGFGLLELPYKGGDLAFDIVLPNEGVPLDKVESSLGLAQLQQAIDRLGEREVSLAMPKFKVTAGAELSEPLSGLGMAQAFTRQADFSGIDGTRELYLSKVVHQVVVNLDEEGTEAAAATGVVVTRAMARVSVPLVFRVDRPFLYLIRDVKTGTILFLGRVADPTR